MPLTIRLLSPTWLAVTSSRTHWPAEGNGPMCRRLFVPAVLPRAVVPLQHDLFRHVGWIEVHVGKELVSTFDGQRCGRPDEEVLVNSRKQVRLVGLRSGEWRRVRANPVPGIPTFRLRGGAGRDRIVDPHDLARGERGEQVSHLDLAQCPTVDANVVQLTVEETVAHPTQRLGV